MRDLNVERVSLTFRHRTRAVAVAGAVDVGAGFGIYYGAGYIGKKLRERKLLAPLKKRMQEKCGVEHFEMRTASVFNLVLHQICTTARINYCRSGEKLYGLSRWQQRHRQVVYHTRPHVRRSHRRQDTAGLIELAFMKNNILKRSVLLNATAPSQCNAINTNCGTRWSSSIVLVRTALCNSPRAIVQAARRRNVLAATTPPRWRRPTTTLWCSSLLI